MRYLSLLLLCFALVGCDSSGSNDSGPADLRIQAVASSPVEYFVVGKSGMGNRFSLGDARGRSYTFGTPGSRSHSLASDSTLLVTQINNENVERAHIKVFRQGELLGEAVAQTKQQAYIRVDGGTLRVTTGAK